MRNQRPQEWKAEYLCPCRYYVSDLVQSVSAVLGSTEYRTCSWFVQAALRPMRCIVRLVN